MGVSAKELTPMSGGSYFSTPHLVGAGFGAALAYAYSYDSLIGLAIGAVAGGLAYPMLQDRVRVIALPIIPAGKQDYVLPSILGGVAAYGMYGPDYLYVAGGAAAGAGLEYALNSM
jgi:hypothetical protein